jgi:hypothetical protein
MIYSTGSTTDTSVPCPGLVATVKRAPTSSAPVTVPGAPNHFARVEARSVVAHRKRHGAGLAREPDHHAGAARVLVGVLQRLLHHAVQHDLDLARQPADRLGLQGHLGVIGVVVTTDVLAERLGEAAVRHCARPQVGDETPHLSQPLARRLAHAVEHCDELGVLGLLREGVAGLQQHLRVGQHLRRPVVHLARQPHALLLAAVDHLRPECQRPRVVGAGGISLGERRAAHLDLPHELVELPQGVLAGREVVLERLAARPHRRRPPAQLLGRSRAALHGAAVLQQQLIELALGLTQCRAQRLVLAPHARGELAQLGHLLRHERARFAQDRWQLDCWLWDHPHVTRLERVHRSAQPPHVPQGRHAATGPRYDVSAEDTRARVAKLYQMLYWRARALSVTNYSERLRFNNSVCCGFCHCPDSSHAPSRPASMASPCTASRACKGFAVFPRPDTPGRLPR